MLYSLLRGLKVRQIGQVSLNLSISNTATTPTVAGPDAAFVSSIVKNSTGNYTITLKESAKQNLHISSIVPLTADGTAIQTATLTPKVSFNIICKSVAASPVAKDVDFNVAIQFFDQLSYFF